MYRIFFLSFTSRFLKFQTYFTSRFSDKYSERFDRLNDVLHLNFRIFYNFHHWSSLSITFLKISPSYVSNQLLTVYRDIVEKKLLVELIN